MVSLIRSRWALMRLGTAGFIFSVAALVTALTLGFLVTTSAQADFEQVKPSPPEFEDLPFEDPPGEEPLRRTGAAVNVSGSGGVEPGTVYAAAKGHRET